MSDIMDKSLYDKIKSKIAQYAGYDRRTKLGNLSIRNNGHRTSRSDVIQFYSASPNIGNYLPVLGIRRMLGENTDLWDAHDDNIDWDFVNENYSWAIIGGAGLLHSDFECFWRQLAANCRLPFVIWGIGACFPDVADSPGVPYSVAKPVLEEADLINLRDDATANHYDMKSANVSPCPTIVYLEGQKRDGQNSGNTVLFSSHTGLTSDKEEKEICNIIESSTFDLDYTDNIEKRLRGMEDIIEKYKNCSAVITTRLHGAIIAYALKVPYIAIARDDKIRSFNKSYGNGLVFNEIKKIKHCIEDIQTIEIGEIEYYSVHKFAKRVKQVFKY